MFFTISSCSSGFKVGNTITSFIAGLFAKKETNLSIPIPQPAVGGIPYSSAEIKSLSTFIDSSIVPSSNPLRIILLIDYLYI